MDASVRNPDEDRVSLKSDGKTPTKDAVKGALNRFQSFRESVSRAVKSPLSSAGKGSKSKADSATNDAGPPHSPELPSPSPSVGALVFSLLKTGQSSPQKTEDHNEAGISTLTRSETEPDVFTFGESLLKRGESIRRSMGFGSKKVKDKTHPNNVPQTSCQEKNEEEEEEKAFEAMEETYTLPDIPHTPLSVMQINKLIETGMLEEAHLNLLAMRLEFQRELEQCGEDSPMELAKKEKDLNLLYRELRNKISGIVRVSKKDLPGSMARIIQEEERRKEEPGGLQGSWMEAWREAVAQGVQVVVQSVPLEQREQNSSWLAMHLGLLGKAVVEDLENVKRVLQCSYPPSFRVFGTYVRSYRRMVGQHLQELEQQVTKLKDLYTLLDWIINTYKSERIMGSVCLQPDIEGESTDLDLEEDFLKRLKDKYCCQVKEDLRDSLDRVIELENNEVWVSRTPPDKEDDYLLAKFPMDIWTNVKSTVVNTGKLDTQLEQRAIAASLEELKQFPKRFETKFKDLCHAPKQQPLWAEYHIAYINSFTALQQHMEGYSGACPVEVEGFRKEVKWLIVRLMQVLEDQFKEDVTPYLKKMMTKKWLTDNDDFDELYSRMDQLSLHCSVMRPPHVQEFANRLHHHVAMEYIGQLMKNNYSCKNRKHEKAAIKIRQQWGKLGAAFEDMKSTCEWLYPAGDDLSEIIGQKNKKDIKRHLEPLVKHYPDFSINHLVAVLNFRGLWRGREHSLIRQTFTELKHKLGNESIDKSRVLFANMEVNTACLSGLPFPCF